MAEIFLKQDAEFLLKDKKILLLGDSNVRALYKDILWLLKSNSIIDNSFLKRRLEKQYLGDTLLQRSEISRGRDFTEHRTCRSGTTFVEFIFITRCYSKKIEDIFRAIKDGRRAVPDVIYMNSCLWDISRWGPNGVNEFKMNMRNLMKLLTSALPSKTLFLWGTAVPTASCTSGGLIIKQLEFLQAALRVHVLEANKFTSSLVSSYGFDVIDFHHFMHFQICRRSADGIHFLPHALRFMTNLLLTHLALSWDVVLPRRIKVFPGPLEKVLIAACQVGSAKVEKLVKKIDAIASNLNPPGPTGQSKQKKKRNRRKKSLKKLSHVPQTPPTYCKAPQPTFGISQGSMVSTGSLRSEDESFTEDTYEGSFSGNNNSVYNNTYISHQNNESLESPFTRNYECPVPSQNIVRTVLNNPLTTNQAQNNQRVTFNNFNWANCTPSFGGNPFSEWTARFAQDYNFSVWLINQNTDVWSGNRNPLPSWYNGQNTILFPAGRNSDSWTRNNYNTGYWIGSRNSDIWPQNWDANVNGGGAMRNTGRSRRRPFPYNIPHQSGSYY